MAVSLYFGLPGCGKTTLACYFAKKGVRSRRYQHVWTNVPNTIPGVTYIDNWVIGQCHLENGLIIIDEATLFADSRDHKNFPKHLIEFFLLHRHYNVDIILLTQQWDGVDKKIRVITDRVYYVYKGIILGKWFTRFYRIPYGIIIPDPKKNDSQKLGEIVQGYCKPGLLVRLFSPWVFRPLYYKYFDSWECKPLKPLPAEYSPFVLQRGTGKSGWFAPVVNFFIRTPSPGNLGQMSREEIEELNREYDEKEELRKADTAAYKAAMCDTDKS